MHPAHTSDAGDAGTGILAKVGDWVTSVAYEFAGGQVVMDLGPDMVRIRLDRSEITAKRRFLQRASTEEIAAAKERRSSNPPISRKEAGLPPRHRPRRHS